MNIKQILRSQEGFTLVELAVVLVIVGILLGSVIGTLSSRIETTRKSDTVDELNEIKQAMMAHAFVHGYLPCPDCADNNGGCATASVGDVGDGAADYDATTEACFEGDGAGNVPWVTLGLGRSDAWGTRYRYAVQSEYSIQKLDPITHTPFHLNSIGGVFAIEEPDYVADPTGTASHNLATRVVAVIFSHGKNGFGGVSENNFPRAGIPSTHIDELKNTDDDIKYYMRSETASTASITGKEFDDIVIWISEYELKAIMVEAGKLP